MMTAKKIVLAIKVNIFKLILFSVLKNKILKPHIIIHTGNTTAAKPKDCKKKSDKKFPVIFV